MVFTQRMIMIIPNWNNGTETILVTKSISNSEAVLPIGESSQFEAGYKETLMN
jgi:hypothetical protein